MLGRVGRSKIEGGGEGRFMEINEMGVGYVPYVQREIYWWLGCCYIHDMNEDQIVSVHCADLRLFNSNSWFNSNRVQNGHSIRDIIIQ